MIKLNYIKNYGDALITFKPKTISYTKFHNCYYEEDDPIYLFGLKIFARKKKILIETPIIEIIDND